VARVSAEISSLLSGQVYHSRLVVSNVAGLASGADHPFITGGKVFEFTWSANDSGATPAPTGFSDVVATASGGGSHSLALRTDGTVIAWGDNYSGQTTLPVGLSNVVAVADGGGHSLALRGDGTVIGWGNNDSGQIMALASLTNIVAVAAGGSHSLALRRNGTVMAWGANYSGQASPPTGLSNVVAVAAGQAHSLALRSDGTVRAWGNYYYGNSGPAAIVPAGLSNVVAVAAGSYYSLALRSDGTVIAWGLNVVGYAVGKATVPAGLSNVVAVAAGNYSLALLSDGTIVRWNQYYDYNSATWIQVTVSVPAGLSKVVAITSGASQSLALVANSAPIATPQTVTGPANSDLIITLAASDFDDDPLSFSIIALPDVGRLYQYGVGQRGAAITASNLAVSDPSGRIIFAPALNGFGDPYASFTFAASDGQSVSSPASVTLRVTALPPAPPLFTRVAWNATSGFVLNFSGSTNASYQVWFSTDLIQWELLGSAVQITAGMFQFTDPIAPNDSARFYSLESR
jgi:hypothetical protein